MPRGSPEDLNMAEIITGYFPTPAERVVRDVEALIAHYESGFAPDFPAILKSRSRAWPDYLHPHLVMTRRGEVRIDLSHSVNRSYGPDDVVSERIVPMVRCDALVDVLRKVLPRLLEGLAKNSRHYLHHGESRWFRPDGNVCRGELRLATDEACEKAVGGTWIKNPSIPLREVTFAEMFPEPA
jgi:hypothetical protein